MTITDFLRGRSLYRGNRGLWVSSISNKSTRFLYCNSILLRELEEDLKEFFQKVKCTNYIFNLESQAVKFPDKYTEMLYWFLYSKELRSN